MRVKTVKRLNPTLLTSYANSETKNVKNRVEKLAYTFMELVKEIIETQSIRWTRLSDEYIARKVSEGWDSRILIATGQYLENIYVEKGEKEYQVAVRDIAHDVSGLSLSDLAVILEFGTDVVPARPHWRPAWTEFLKKYGRLTK